jgi:hypothetical protein
MSFLRSISRHFHAISRDEYALERDVLLRRKHPLTWLRIQLLCNRARVMGHEEAADRVVEQWQSTARELGIDAEYHGTWDEALRGDFNKMLDDMLVQASLPTATDEDSCRSAPETVLGLFHAAWAAHDRAPDSYEDWERRAVRRFVSRL